jgi:CHAT domain-containing protein/tetratricopeptide (TPR) repeat protein
MLLQLKSPGRLAASICFLFFVSMPISNGWAQQEAQPQPDPAQDFQNIFKDLFKAPDSGAAGQATDQKNADPTAQVLQQLLQGLTPDAGGQGKPAGDGNPFGGLVEGLLRAQQQQAGGEGCKDFIARMSLQDMIKPIGSEADREKHKNFTNLHLAAVQALLRQDWEEHIRIAHEALLVEKEIGEWPSAGPRGLVMGSHWANLASAYLSRQQGDTAENIENGISAALKAAEHMPKEGVCAEQRSIAQVNLAVGYTRRIRGEKAENLELAIATLEAVLQTISRDALPEMWARAHTNLGVAYINRIRGRTRENQDRAIQAYNTALQGWDQQGQSELWAMTQSNLGAAYIRRVSGDHAENIELAIAALEAALNVRKPEASGGAKPAVVATVKDPTTDKDPNQEFFAVLKDAYELMAVVERSEAGAVHVMDPAAWADTYQNLAVAYQKRIRGDREENIERSIAAHDMSVTFWKRDTHADRWAMAHHNLGETLLLRSKGGKTANIDRAIESLRLTLSVRTAESFPRGHLNTATVLGQALSAKGDWSGALEAFDSARTSFRVLFGQGLNEVEARGLLQDAGPLFTDAAYAAAAKGEVSRAFELLEEGKARLLAVALKLDRLPVSAADRKKLEELRRQIRVGEAAYEAARGEEKAAKIAHLGQLRADLLKLVDATEAKNGAEQGKDVATAAAQILPKNGALVAPIIGDAGGKAILVTHAQGRVVIEAIDFPGLDRARLNRLLGARDQGGWLGAYSRQMDYQSEWRAAIDIVGQELGRLFGAPLIEALAARGMRPGADAQLTILPVGPLGLLPLALARHPVTGRHLTEDYTINFAPSLGALVAAKSRAGGRSGGEPTLAVIINPTEDLSSTELEGALVGSRFAANGRRSLARKDATSDAVLTALKGRDYWHFSSHGFFDWDEPRASGLLMAARQPLTVGTLMDAREIGAPRLAVLSACETGLYDIATTPNEFTGLPAAFMRLGAGGVLATLWPVDDLSTALLIARFYDLHRGENLSPAAALRSAQSWLRAASENELKAYLRLAVEEGRLPKSFLHGVDAMLRAARGSQAPGSPYGHPYYWSGFTLTGL